MLERIIPGGAQHETMTETHFQTAWIEILLIAVALGCDAFAVGLGVGTRYFGRRPVFRLSFHFGLFQFLMPIVGWFAGVNLIGAARAWGPWIAFGLLMFLGAKMIYESVFHEPGSRPDNDPTRGLSLVALSVATSLDALGVGFSLGVLGRTLWGSAVIIGITAGLMTWLAMALGNRLTERFGHRMGALGGVILIGIAIKFVVS